VTHQKEKENIFVVLCKHWYGS